MSWVAPTEKDTANQTLEKRLSAAADQFRANSGLKAGQYSTPVLGLIFLRFAEARFAQRRAWQIGTIFSDAQWLAVMVSQRVIQDCAAKSSVKPVRSVLPFLGQRGGYGA